MSSHFFHEEDLAHQYQAGTLSTYLEGVALLAKIKFCNEHGLGDFMPVVLSTQTADLCPLQCPEPGHGHLRGLYRL